MIIGEKKSFAIEFEIDPDPGGEWLFGRVCYWLCGHRVGDYELVTSLRDVMISWERIAGDSSRRENPRLAELDGELLFQSLQGGLFGKDTTHPDLERLAIDEQWARHVVTPTVDVFDDWQVFLVEGPSGARCVHRQLPMGVINECTLARGEFDRILARVLEMKDLTSGSRSGGGSRAETGSFAHTGTCAALQDDGVRL